MQKQCLNDNSYNITKQLTKTLELLYHMNHYIQDAEKCNSSEAKKVWEKIRADEERHADMLRDLLTSEVKANKF